jgi:hypothetical protein
MRIITRYGFLLFIIIFASCDTMDVAPTECNVTLEDIIVYEPLPDEVGDDDGFNRSASNDVEVKSFSYKQVGEGEAQITFQSINEDLNTTYRIVVYDFYAQDFITEHNIRSANKPSKSRYTCTLRNIPTDTRLAVYLLVTKNGRSEWLGGKFMYLNPAS